MCIGINRESSRFHPPERDLGCAREAGSGNRHLGSHRPTGRAEGLYHRSDAEDFVAGQRSCGGGYGHGPAGRASWNNCGQVGVGNHRERGCDSMKRDLGRPGQTLAEDFDSLPDSALK